MSSIHRVEQGDCMSSIALQYGFTWQKLWNLPANAALKQSRRSPNVLVAGDQVVIPDKDVTPVARPSGARHAFVKLAAVEKFRMRFVDAQHQPRAGLAYVITIDGKSRRGQTDANGELVVPIAPDAQAGTIVLEHAGPPGGPPGRAPRRETFAVKLGHLDPVTEVSGVKARLANLRFYRGPVDSALDDLTREALTKFQTVKGLPVTGEADDATKALLQALHGH